MRGTMYSHGNTYIPAFHAFPQQLSAKVGHVGSAQLAEVKYHKCPVHLEALVQEKYVSIDEADSHHIPIVYSLGVIVT